MVDAGHSHRSRSPNAAPLWRVRLDHHPIGRTRTQPSVVSSAARPPGQPTSCRRTGNDASGPRTRCAVHLLARPTRFCCDHRCSRPDQSPPASRILFSRGERSAPRTPAPRAIRLGGSKRRSNFHQLRGRDHVASNTPECQVQSVTLNLPNGAVHSPLADTARRS
jgi:hypothetical protein